MGLTSLPKMDFKTYLFTYHYDGANWEIPISAKTPEEARARLNRIPYATYTGELIASISVPPTVSRISIFLRRLFRLSR
jgi:hypothetical protein